MPEYISKESVLLKCADIWDNADETTQTGVDTINTIDKITDFIESLPTADVQPVKFARWIDLDNRILCSGCGAGYDDSDEVKRNTYIFCPNCGARVMQDGDAE